MAWKQTISQRETLGTSEACAGRGNPPQLGRTGVCARRRCTALLKVSSHHLQPHCTIGGPEATKPRKQLVAGKATHKSDLDGSCILLGVEGLEVVGAGGGGRGGSDIVIRSAHYLGVNMEMEPR